MRLSNFQVALIMSAISTVYSLAFQWSTLANMPTYKTHPIPTIIGFCVGAGFGAMVLYGLPLWGILVLRDKLVEEDEEKDSESTVESDDMDKAA